MRRYPPLAWVLVACAVTVFVLPTALNVPQSQPSRTLEFAPVPAEDEVAPDAPGNVASLGLGASGTIERGAGSDGADAPLPPAPELPSAVGERPVTKRCVGDPPRQTEDPLSPPCVAHFEGDNRGATAPGVTGSQVRVVFYFDGRGPGTAYATSRGAEPYPEPGTIYDLAEPPEEDDYVHARVLRRYQRYFNERFQTYGRSVRFVLQYGDADRSPEAVRGDALRTVTELDPFATVNFSVRNGDVFTTALAENGRMVFLGSDRNSAVGQPAAEQRRFPGLLWSFRPTLEERARLFTSFACTTVVPAPVSFSGNEDHGQPRAFGLLHTDDETRQDLLALADLYRDGLTACGANIVDEGTFGHTACSVCSSEEHQRATVTLARFQQSGVTTIVWGGGSNGAPSRAATAMGWHPEWVVAGDGYAEDTLQNQQYSGESWQHARLATTAPLVTDFDQRHCAQAIWEVDPEFPRTDVQLFACDMYPSLMQLFTGIQVAGPRLTAETMDRGFHAIPAVPSGDPTVPACFYRPGDYSCVKDMAVGWWDPEGRTSSGTVGCWRMMERGARYLADTWPEGDVESRRDPSADPCSDIGRTSVN